MEQLGIEPSLLLAQIVNFSIIAFILTKVLYKPVLRMLEERKKKIEEGLALAEKMQTAEEQIKQKEASMLERARIDAHELIEEAKKQAKHEEKEIIEQARKEASRIVERGKLEAQNHRKAMDDQIRKEAIELAVVMSRRLLSEVLTESEQHRVLSKHIEKLNTLRV